LWTLPKANRRVHDQTGHLAGEAGLGGGILSEGGGDGNAWGLFQTTLTCGKQIQ
jgi:hypothetical protein